MEEVIMPEAIITIIMGTITDTMTGDMPVIKIDQKSLGNFVIKAFLIINFRKNSF